MLAITAVAGLLLAISAAVTGSGLLASLSAVFSAMAATIAIGLYRRLLKAPAAAAKNAAVRVPAGVARPVMGTPRPVLPANGRLAETDPPSTDAPSWAARPLNPAPTAAAGAYTSARPAPPPAAPPLPAPQTAPQAAGRATPEEPAPLWAVPEAGESALLDMPSTLEALSHALRSAGAVVAAHVWLLDPATGSLRLIEAIGAATPPSLPVARNDTVLGRALDESGIVVAPLSRKLSDESPPLWRLAFPLDLADAEGVVAVDFEGDAEPNGAAVAAGVRAVRGALLATFATHVATLRGDAARSLLDATMDLSARVDPDAVVNALLCCAAEMTGADTASVMLADPTGSTLSIASAKGLPVEVVETASVPAGADIAGLVFSSGNPMVVEDSPGSSTIGRRHGVRSSISIPIADAEGSLGVLNVGRRMYPTTLSDVTLASLESLGRLGAATLRRARQVQDAGDLYLDALRTLALAVEAKDPCSHGGTERVVESAAALGSAMGLDAGELRSLEIAALLHDIGMIATGDASSVRARPLTTVEWALLKMHPVVAAELLEQAPTLRDVAPIVYHHHEHYDGTGYAAGLSGEDIPLAARVLAVADAYVAMTSHRPYRQSMTPEDALGELDRGAGTQFDPRVVSALHEILAAERDGAPAWCA